MTLGAAPVKSSEMAATCWSSSSFVAAQPSWRGLLRVALFSSVLQASVIFHVGSALETPKEPPPLFAYSGEAKCWVDQAGRRYKNCTRDIGDEKHPMICIGSDVVNVRGQRVNPDTGEVQNPAPIEHRSGAELPCGIVEASDEWLTKDGYMSSEWVNQTAQQMAKNVNKRNLMEWMPLDPARPKDSDPFIVTHTCFREDVIKRKLALAYENMTNPPGKSQKEMMAKIVDAAVQYQMNFLKNIHVKPKCLWRRRKYRDRCNEKTSLWTDTLQNAIMCEADKRKLCSEVSPKPKTSGIDIPLTAVSTS